MSLTTSSPSSFKSKSDNILFIIIVFLVLLSPIYTHYLVKRQDAYDSVPLRMGSSYSYIADEIFSKNEDIDVLFLGSSDMWTSYSPNILKAKWKQQYGKDYNIIMFAANWRGYDKLYFMLKDLLAHRKVKLVLLSIYGRKQDPHFVAKYLWNFYDHWADFSDLSWRTRIRYYAESILGCPQLLLTLLHKMFNYPKYFSPEIKADLGALITNQGYDPQTPGAKGSKKSFKVNMDKAPTLILSDVLYNGAGSADRHFAAPLPMNNFELYFYNLIVQLCKEKKVKLALIQTPFPTDNPQALLLYQWSFDKDIPTIGIPQNKLFPGMSKENIEDFYYNPGHMNRNGSRYYTEALSEIIYNDLFK